MTIIYCSSMKAQFEVLRQMCTDVFSPVEGVLTQSQTRCCVNDLSGPSGTPQGGCRSPPAPDRYCSAVVTPGAYICHRRVMQYLLNCTSGSGNLLIHAGDVFKILTWSSRKQRWDRGWCYRLWLKWREPCTGCCHQHNLKKMGRCILILLYNFATPKCEK